MLMFDKAATPVCRYVPETDDSSYGHLLSKEGCRTIPLSTSLAKGHGIKHSVQELPYEIKPVNIYELIMIHEFGSDSPTAIQDKWHKYLQYSTPAKSDSPTAIQEHGKEKIFKKKVCELGPLAHTLRHEDVHIEFIANIYPCLTQLPVWDWAAAF